MKTLKYFIIFFVLNFMALGIGVLLMDNGPRTEWYLKLNKAPWTPPGWFFAVAWNTIMLCFSFYMAYLYNLYPTAKVKILFIIQFFLNFGWNYVFFNQHFIALGLFVILSLTGVVTVFLYDYKKQLSYKTLLILPYFLWLCIPCSLNLYILLNN